MRRTGVLLAATITAFVAVSVALASTAGVGKKTIGGRDLATDVIISFTAPKGYTLEGGVGAWKGPRSPTSTSTARSSRASSSTFTQP